jgi:GH24 family phage-related lysozyme (muramidase)
MRFVLMLSLVLAAGACASAPSPRAIAPSAPPAATSPAAPASGLSAATQLVTNDAGIAIIKKSEALRLDSYELGGSEFIGYGHLMKQGEADHITEAKADALLKADLGDCEAALRRGLTVPVSPNEFSALVSLCYNIGTGNLASSSAIKALNKGDRAGAGDAFLLWNKAGGVVLDRLTARRKEERALFLKP